MYASLTHWPRSLADNRNREISDIRILAGCVRRMWLLGYNLAVAVGFIALAGGVARMVGERGFATLGRHRSGGTESMLKFIYFSRTVMPKVFACLVVTFATLLTASAFAEDKHEKHMHRFSKDVDALHAVLAPLWHERAGKERSQKVCAQAHRLESLTKDIDSGDTKALLTSLTALKTQCQASPADIDAVFSEVHDAFHHLADPQG